MSINIRKANASDAQFLAEMILQSSRAGKKLCLFDLIFDTNDESEVLKKIEALTQTKAKNHCSFENFLVAEHDGELVGTLCSYEPRFATHDTFMDALNEVGCSNNTKEILDIVYECDFDLNNRTLMFDFMEEKKGFIDIGVLKSLMQKSLLTARLKGYGIAQTIVETGSKDKILFFKKLGFSVKKENECENYKEQFGRAGLTLLATEF
jgi:N-acetylglutamate synthase-like GNAT family acetyltransferase